MLSPYTHSVILPCLYIVHSNNRGIARLTQRKKATIHQVTTMLATSKNVLFLGPNHMLITGADNPTL